LYNSSELSDITINFSGRKVKAHRFVLCVETYFKKLCHPDSGFAVNNHIKICELSG
jgi:hypothetical protein